MVKLNARKISTARIVLDDYPQRHYLLGHHRGQLSRVWPGSTISDMTKFMSSTRKE